MKNIKYAIFAALAVTALAGCRQNELMDYRIDGEAINFYSVDERLAGINQESYPDILTKIYEINTYSNNTKGVAEVAIDFSVQTMGVIRDFDRKAVMHAVETKGYQAELPYREVVVPAGLNLVQIDTLPIDYIPKGYMTTWVIEFDYAAGDFAPGLEERQKRTITIDNRYTYSSVGIAKDQWDVIAGDKAAGFIGLGPFSSVKAMFIVNVLGTYEFGEIYGLASAYQEFARMGWGDFGYEAYWQPIVEPLRAALEEYKINSETDPATYPPLLDDVKNDGSWIALVEE